MSWKDKMKEFGGGDFTFLSEDGESLIFAVCDEPVLIKSEFKGKPQDRIGCPVMTEDGFMLLIGGKRLARRLSKFESKFKTCAFMVTRFGEANDQNAKYPVEVLKDDVITKALLELVKTDYKPELLKQAVKDYEAMAR